MLYNLRDTVFPVKAGERKTERIRCGAGDVAKEGVDKIQREKHKTDMTDVEVQEQVMYSPS